MAEKFDKGHALLEADSRELHRKVESFEFHDFKNKKFALPKVELIKELQRMIDMVKEGYYDN